MNENEKPSGATPGQSNLPEQTGSEYFEKHKRADALGQVPSAFEYGFRIIGAINGRRQAVHATSVFRVYAECSHRVNPASEGYLSAFQFDLEFRKQLDATRTTAKFDGPCWSPWIWFDIDRKDDLDGAKGDARQICSTICERYGCEEGLLVFFSGAKGFHIGMPSTLAKTQPSHTFNRAARCFAEEIAAMAAVRIDAKIYDKLRAFRAPNSWHPKTGLYKVRLTVDELMHLKLEAILELAKNPRPFDVPEDVDPVERAVEDWKGAENEAAQRIRSMRGALTEKNGREHKPLKYSGLSVPSVTTPSEAILRSLPSEAGQRNYCLFNLARWLKSMPEYADALPEVLKPIVREWYDKSESIIATKDFEASWADFMWSWERVEYPMGAGPMGNFVKEAQSAAPPAVAANYERAEMRLLISLLRVMQKHSGEVPLRLDYRTAGKFIGVDHNTAGKWLRALCIDGHLELVLQGRQGRASRWKYIGGD